MSALLGLLASALIALALIAGLATDPLSSVVGIVAAAGVAALATVGWLLVRVFERFDRGYLQSPEAGTADLLNYATPVADDVVLLKNGALLAVIRYWVKDEASSSATEREQLADRIGGALSTLGNGWMLHVDQVRVEASKYRGGGAFTDRICQAIDDERRQFFNQAGTLLDDQFLISITYKPPHIAEQRLINLMTTGPKTPRDNNADDVVEKFREKLTELQNRLSLGFRSTVRLSTRDVKGPLGPVRHNDLLQWIHLCITGLRHPLAVPDGLVHADLLVGGQELRGGNEPQIGTKHIRVVAIEGFPDATHPGLLSALGELRFPLRVSSRFIFLDAHQAADRLKKFRAKWAQQITSMRSAATGSATGPVDLDALDVAREAPEAIKDATRERMKYGYFTNVIIIMDDDAEVAQANAVIAMQTVTRLGFRAARIETVNAVEAWLGSLPGHSRENLRRPLLGSDHLANCFPTHAKWSGSATAPCPFYPDDSPPMMQVVTSGATPYYANLHVRDVGHTLIFGPTTAGKSTLLGFIVAQARKYPDMDIYVFDRGCSMQVLANAIRTTTDGKSGSHYMIGASAGGPSFAPLSSLQTKGDRTWALGWVESTLTLAGLNVTVEHRVQIEDALKSMAATGDKSLSDFVTTVQDPDIRAALNPYTSENAMGHLLDAVEDSITLSDLNVFEYDELMTLPAKFSVPVLLYLFRRVEVAAKTTETPTLIILDEAWGPLGNPVFRPKIVEWLATLRKSNCAVILATQSISSAVKSGVLDVLLESTATKIYLANPEAQKPAPAEFYEQVGVGEDERAQLAGAIPQRDYYLVSSQGRRMFNMSLGPLALAFCGASGQADREAVARLEKAHGNGWIPRWLHERRVPAPKTEEAA